MISSNGKQAELVKLSWAYREWFLARISDDYGDAGYARPMVYKLLVLKKAPEPPLPFSARQESEAEWFEARYDFLAMHFASAETPPNPLGKEVDRHCRYCLKSEPETSFQTVAHAFPHMIGNHWLVDYWECDACNMHFSKYLESDFGAWTLPLRGIAAVEGKNGVPTLVSPDQKIRIEVDEHGRRTIRIEHGATGFELDEINKTIQFPVNRPSFNPMGAFKSLVKMALSVMPEIEAAKSAHLRKWLLEPGHSTESFPYKPLIVLCEFFPGLISPDQFTFGLLRRKRGAPDDCPYMQFFLQFANQVFQIAVPMPNKDRRIIGRPITLVRFPTPWTSEEYVHMHGPSFLSVEDLSSHRRRRSAATKMSLGFEALVLADSAT